jgi:diadenylate cyclase
MTLLTLWETLKTFWTSTVNTVLSFWVDWMAPALEFLLILLIVYRLLYFFRRTRAISVLWGLIVILLGLEAFSSILNFKVFNWILLNLWQTLALALIVIFQPELRRAIAQLGSYFSLFSHAHQQAQKEAIEEIVSAMIQMSIRRCGALIVIERRIGLAAIINNAVQLDAKINSLLLQSLFYPDSPLHDGAVIIQDGKIVAAHAILPLTQEEFYLPHGTRHRAALGISEETDAIALVVSEETGTISYACKGKLSHDVSEAELTEFLKREILEQKPAPQQEKEDDKAHGRI